MGKAIVELRARRGMTRQDLATAAGVSAEGIRKLERGLTSRPSLEYLTKIAAVFGMTAQELLPPGGSDVAGSVRSIAGDDWERRDIMRYAPTTPIQEAIDLLEDWEHLSPAGKKAAKAMFDGLRQAEQKERGRNKVSERSAGYEVESEAHEG